MTTIQETAGMKTLLHVGCGHQGKEALPPLDFENEWREVRVDIDPGVNPDVIDDIRTLATIPDGSAHYLFSKHNLEHLEFHDVPRCLANFYRVLDDTGFLIIRTPNLEQVCRAILEVGVEKNLYTANINGERNPVMPMDILFGASWEIEKGNHFMAHRTAFTAKNLEQKLRDAGFEHVDIKPAEASYELLAVAVKKIDGNVYWPLRGKTPPAAATTRV